MQSLRRNHITACAWVWTLTTCQYNSGAKHCGGQSSEPLPDLTEFELSQKCIEVSPSIAINGSDYLHLLSVCIASSIHQHRQQHWSKCCLASRCSYGLILAVPIHINRAMEPQVNVCVRVLHGIVQLIEAEKSIAGSCCQRHAQLGSSPSFLQNHLSLSISIRSKEFAKAG